MCCRARPLPTLRRRDCYKVVRRALQAGAARKGFRVIEYSVQANHIHMVCEASNRESLARGLQGLFVRIARRLNRSSESFIPAKNRYSTTRA